MCNTWSHFFALPRWEFQLEQYSTFWCLLWIPRVAFLYSVKKWALETCRRASCNKWGKTWSCIVWRNSHQAILPRFSLKKLMSNTRYFSHALVGDRLKAVCCSRPRGSQRSLTWVRMQELQATPLLTNQRQEAMLLVSVPDLASPDASYFLSNAGTDVSTSPVPFCTWNRL